MVPSSNEAEGACVPSGDTQQTLKAGTKLNFVVQTNDQGWAIVGFTPTVAGDAPIAWYSQAGSTYNGGGAGYNWQTGGGVEAPIPVLATGLPFNSNTLTAPSGSPATDQPALAARLVAFGASIEYIGTVVQDGAEIISWVNPTHDPVQNTSASFGAVSAQPDACLKRIVNGASADLVVFPTMEGEDSFSKLTGPQTTTLPDPRIWPLSYAQSGGTTANAASGMFPLPIAVFVITAASPGAKFRVRVNVHVEYCGSAARYGSTPTISDPNGYGFIKSALARVGQAYSTSKDYVVAFRQAIMDAAKEYGPEYYPAAKKMAAHVASFYVAERRARMRMIRNEL